MKSFLKILNNKIVQTAAFIAAITGITTFAVNLYTQQLENEVVQCKKNLSNCEDHKYDSEIIVGIDKVKIKDMIDEVCYLRYLQQYYDAIAKYEQNRTEENQEIMKYATNALANYIVLKHKQIIKDKKDEQAFIVLISSNKIKFNTQEYYIPQPVWMRVSDPGVYTLTNEVK